MTDIATSTNHIQVNVVRVGQGSQFIELPEGSSGAALLEALTNEGLTTDSARVTLGGREVQADAPIEEGSTVFVGPRNVKQGL